MSAQLRFRRKSLESPTKRAMARLWYMGMMLNPMVHTD